MFTAWPRSSASTRTATTASLSELGESVEQRRSRTLFMILTNTFICKVLYSCRCLGSFHLLSGTLCPSSSSFTSESFGCCAPPSEPNHFLCLTDDSGDVLLLRLLCSMPFRSASATKKKKKKTQRKGSGVTPLWTVKFPPAVVSTAC